MHIGRLYLPISKELNTISLPGEEIEAFAGFASLKARKYAFEFGKLSTLYSLSEIKDGFRENNAFLREEALGQLEAGMVNSVKDINFFDSNSNYEEELMKNLFTPSVKRLRGLISQNRFVQLLLGKVPFAISGLFAAPALLFQSIFKKVPWRGNQIFNGFIKKGGEAVNFANLEPIVISIMSDTKLDRELMVAFEKEKIQKYKLLETKTLWYGKERYQYYFQAYKLEYLKHTQGVDSSDLTTTSKALKLNPKEVDAIKLTMKSKVRLPRDIDGNLNKGAKYNALEASYTEIIKGMRIGRFNLSDVNRFMNDKESSLHYCLINSNAHVNPVLEIDVDKIQEGWYFKEQTVPLDVKLLNN